MSLASAPSPAQQVRDSHGTDFWLAFLPNDRNLTASNPSLHIMITSEFATNGTVQATSRAGLTTDIPFAIGANGIVTLQLDPTQYELQGTNYKTGSTGDAETPLRSTVHITSNADITVYAESRETNTTDAWLVLPTDALGFDYRVLSYPSFAYVNAATASVEQGFPSQFAVIATQSNTRVDIDLSTGASSVSPLPRRTIILQTGEVYLVQAPSSYARPNEDLTGTRIRANRPIAVLSGHFRAQVPIRDISGGTRDFLIEQLPSIETWGNQCVVVPPKPTEDAVAYGPWDNSICRILAYANNTVVNTNGAITTLASGGYVDVPLTEVLLITATEPILCAILARTSNRGGTSSNLAGDPFLLVVPPPEQFQNAYNVVCVEPNTIDLAFKEHWLTVVVPLAAEASLRVDGVAPQPLTPIPGTTLGYAHVSVAPGSHRATCDSAFGLYIYGYGEAESYGYTGGMSFERLYKPTVILRAHDMHAPAGRLDTLIVTVDSISDLQSFSAYGARRLDVQLSWNASLFVPRNSGGMLLNGVQATLSASFAFDSLYPGDTVFSIPGYHALGNAESTDLNITDIGWFDAADGTVEIATTVRNGLITTEGICRDENVRLFDPLQPRPTSQTGSSIEVSGIHGITYSPTGLAFLHCLRPSANAHTVDVYNMLGRLTQQVIVPAHCKTLLPLIAAPYEPLFVR